MTFQTHQWVIGVGNSLPTALRALVAVYYVIGAIKCYEIAVAVTGIRWFAAVFACLFCMLTVLAAFGVLKCRSHPLEVEIFLWAVKPFFAILYSIQIRPPNMIVCAIIFFIADIVATVLANHLSTGKSEVPRPSSGDCGGQPSNIPERIPTPEEQREKEKGDETVDSDHPREPNSPERKHAANNTPLRRPKNRERPGPKKKPPTSERKKKPRINSNSNKGGRA
jgi:hypothetical protein